jgi:hypothetical protein
VREKIDAIFARMRQDMDTALLRLDELEANQVVPAEQKENVIRRAYRDGSYDMACELVRATLGHWGDHAPYSDLARESNGYYSESVSYSEEASHGSTE